MSFPDLPEGYDRHRETLVIVDPGACNPAGVALAIHNACRQAIAEGRRSAHRPGDPPDDHPARLPHRRQLRVSISRSISAPDGGLPRAAPPPAGNRPAPESAS